MKGQERVAKIRELLPQIAQHVNKYTKSSDREAFKVLIVTYLYRSIAFVLYWYQYNLLAVLLDALTTFRSFAVFHECLHGNFFATPQYNKFFHHLLSIDVITPASYWKNNHILHHSILGNSDIYDNSNSIPYSKKQFQELSRTKKLIFRIFREPIIFFTVVPLIQWGLQYPILHGNPILWIGYAIKISLIYYFSPYTFFGVYFAAIMGLTIFHLQHGANENIRFTADKFNKDECAILSSTHILIPWPIAIFTIGIEFHHIHHYNSRVPCYLIRKCHIDGEHFWKGLVTSVTFSNIWESLNTVMWDDETKKLVLSF